MELEKRQENVGLQFDLAAQNEELQGLIEITFIIKSNN